MIRLVLTVLAALGFLWAALNDAAAQDGAGHSVTIAAPAESVAPDAVPPAAPGGDAKAPDATLPADATSPTEAGSLASPATTAPMSAEADANPAAAPASGVPAPADGERVTPAAPAATAAASDAGTTNVDAAVTPAAGSETHVHATSDQPVTAAKSEDAKPDVSIDASADTTSKVATDAVAAPASEPPAAAPADTAIAAATEDATPPAPRRFGLYHRDARIVMEATEESWVRVSDSEGGLVFMRIMKPGETYNIPNRTGLVLDSGNAKGLVLKVDGKPVTLTGIVRRNIALDPETLPYRITFNEPPAQKAATAPTPAQVPDTPPAPVADPGPEGRPVALAAVSADAPNAVVTPAPAVVDAAPKPPTLAAVITPPVAAPPRARLSPAPSPSHAPAAPADRETKPARTQSASVALPRVVAERPVVTQPLTGAAGIAPSGVIGSNGSRIAVETNKGTLVRLRHPASAVFVADPEVADIQMKSAGLVYILGKRPGETVLYAVDDNERVLLNTTLVVSHNISRLRAALRAVAPDAPVDVVSVDGTLILTGTVASAAEAENIRAVAARFLPEKGAIINQLKVVAPNQVNLRVRIAEVSRETLKSFGVNWDAVLTTGNFAFGIATGQFVTTTAFNNVITGSYSSNSLDLNALVDALGTEGLITVLAEPNLTAMSGETASFLAGGEFPIPIAYPENNTISIQFKPFGVGLAFTPTLLDGNRINLRVRPEVSQLSAVGAIQLSGFSIPALQTRRAETTVELASGQSFAIAGLLQNNSNQDISKVPFLGDVPILGPLFRSDRFRRNESELVIIVTPYIVRPVSAPRLAAPTDGLMPPNDVERILGGLAYRQQLPERSEAPRLRGGQGLIGPAGFALD